MTIREPLHDWTLGALSLVNPSLDVNFELHALSSEDDTDWGPAEPVVSVAASFLHDGALESIDRFENREITIGIEATGETSDDLAAAEEALMAECGRRNESVYTPPDGWGAPVVFEVLTSWLTLVFTDGPGGELSLTRRYVLTMRCRPFVKSAESIKVVGPFDGSGVTPITPTETVVRTSAQGLSGWSAARMGTRGEGGPVELVIGTGGRIAARKPAGPDFVYGQPRGFALTYTAAMNLTGAQYLMVEWSMQQASSPAAVTCRITAGGQTYTLPIATQATSSLDGTNTFFALPSGVDLSSVTAVRFHQPTSTIEWFSISRISTWDRWPYESGTGGSQQSIALDVKGTARTEASLYVGHDESALGDVLVWTGPQASGYQPNLTQFRTSGGAKTDDPARLSGSYRALQSTPETVDIPMGNLPQGTYVIYALLRGNAAGGQTLNWSASTYFNSATLGTETGSQFVNLTTNFATYPIGRVVLPVLAAGGDAFVRLTLQSSGAAFVDEWWAFNISDGALSHVKCGDDPPVGGGDASRVWLDTPSLTTPRTSQWLGTEVDRSDAHHGNALTEVMLPGDHRFPPGVVSCFVASTNAVNVAVELEYAPRWHNFPRTLENGAP